MEDLNEAGWIQTYTGKKFYPLAPRVEDVDITDIAHALSNICRYTGHCRKFLSVAEHSVNVADQLPRGLKLAGLLHDAAEAYLCDLPRPLKRIPEFAGVYKAAELRLEKVIAEKFGLPFPFDEQISIADTRMLATEAAQIMTPLHPEWIQQATPYDNVRLYCWYPEGAEEEFLCTFDYLTSISV